MQTGGRQGPEIWLRGPVPLPVDNGPHAEAPKTPERPSSIPTRIATAPRRRFSWVATHGGTGVTTLAEVYGGQDCGRDWPGPEDPRPSCSSPARTPPGWPPSPARWRSSGAARPPRGSTWTPWSS